MSILANQRIMVMSTAKAAKSFGPTGSKDVTSDESAEFLYSSPSNVYSPPQDSEADVLYTTQFHQTAGAKKGLGGTQITANASSTVYGPDRGNRIQKEHTTLLTTLAQLNADKIELSTDYDAHDYFDARYPRALRSYISSKGSADPEFLGGYDADNLYPESVTQTDTGEWVASPVDAVTTGLLGWLATTPGESSTAGGNGGGAGNRASLDPAFSAGFGFDYESVNVAQIRLDFLGEKFVNWGKSDYSEHDAANKLSEDMMQELGALSSSEGLQSPW